LPWYWVPALISFAQKGEIISDRRIYEGNETFTVSLSNPTNGAVVSSTNGTATGGIKNDGDHWNLDIDGDGKFSAFTDGLIILRYLFGPTFSGNTLINNAISPDATRNLSSIQTYLREGVTNKHLDIDNNGSIGVLSDGIMSVRYLIGSGFDGDTLLDKSIALDATRGLTDVQSYFSYLTPPV